MKHVIYYEVGFLNEPKKYFRYTVDRTRFNLTESYIGPTKLVYRSHRIWELDPATGSVEYRKNRQGEGISVDDREFLVVQLAAQEYKSELQL